MFNLLAYSITSIVLMVIYLILFVLFIVPKKLSTKLRFVTAIPVLLISLVSIILNAVKIHENNKRKFGSHNASDSNIGFIIGTIFCGGFLIFCVKDGWEK
jgi:hypothetical protein